MAVFEKIPSNFTPGSMFQLGRAGSIVPAGKNAQQGQFLVSNGHGDWVPASLGWKWIPIAGGTYTCNPTDFATVNQLITANGNCTIILPPPATPRMDILIVVTQNNVTCRIQTTVSGSGPPNIEMPDGNFYSTFFLTTPAVGGYTNLHLISDGANWFAVNEAGATLRVDGDMLVRQNGHLQAIPKGTLGQVLKQGVAIPSWGTPLLTDVGGWNYLNPTTSYTITPADVASKNLLVACSFSAPGTITLPSPVGAGMVVVQNHSGSAVTVVGSMVNSAGVVGSLVLPVNYQQVALVPSTSFWTVLDNDTVMTAAGDLMYRSGAGRTDRLPVGANGQTLIPFAGLPAWSSNLPLLGFVNVGGAGTPLNGSPGDLTAQRLNVGNVAAMNPGETLVNQNGYFLTANNSQTRPVSGASSAGLAVGWNYSNGSGDVGLWNLYQAASYSFSFRQKTGAASHTDLLEILSSGALLNTGYMNVGSLVVPAHTAAGDLSCVHLYASDFAYLSHPVGNYMLYLEGTGAGGRTYGFYVDSSGFLHLDIVGVAQIESVGRPR